MRLYLAQHGPAAAKEVDPDRPLTEDGAAAVGRVASFLQRRNPNVEALEHSGKTRARETAEILSAAFGGVEPAPRAGLAPNDDVEPVSDELARRDGDLLLVGHLPFLSRLAALLLTADAQPAPVTFVPGGVVCLERSGDPASWSIAWAVTPDLLE